MRQALILVVMLVTVGLTASATATAQPDDPVVEAGRVLYGNSCALCHGDAGRGVPELAPPLVEVGAASVDFMIRTGRMPLDRETDTLKRQSQRMTDEERDAIVAYLKTIMTGGPDIPDVSREGDLGDGRRLFTSNCAACHGPTAGGIAVGQKDIAPALHIATPLEIAEAVRTGPGRMPVFSEDVMPPEDLSAVVAWVLDLRDRETPAGVSFGRGGAVSEGFIAWIVGMALLLIVAYFLGEKTYEMGEPDDD